jgi:hypothetical protein
MSFRIQIRRDTSERWEINNPVLLEGEFGYETDTDCLKIGDGQTEWNSLDYLVCGSGQLDIINAVGDTVVTGASALKFTGNGVNVSSSGKTAIINVPSGGGGGGNSVGVYSIKLEFNGGSLSPNPFVMAKDPEGVSLIGTSGWSFYRDSNNQITIQHPQEKWFINFNRFAQQVPFGNEWVSAAISGSSFSLNTVKNYTDQASFTIQALDSARTGISGTGLAYMFITWQEPINNFFE